MGRTRKTNKHLPPRVYLRHGTYYFADITGRWTRLGRTVADMYRELAALAEPRTIHRMADLFDRYRIEILPRKRERTQVEHRRALERLTAVFGRMRPQDVRPADVTAYRDKRATQKVIKAGKGHRRIGGKIAASRELEVLKHALRLAVEWGVIDSNPAREVSKLRNPKRRRYVTDDEYRIVYDLAPPMVQVAMELAVLTGQRRGDLLALTRDQLADQGIVFEQSKTGKVLIIEWSDDLRAVIARAKALPPHVRRHVICNRSGHPYTADGFATLWDRTMKAALEGGLAERFRFHDLRAKSASDDSAEAATARMGHADAATTARFYRRRPSVARPLR